MMTLLLILVTWVKALIIIFAISTVLYIGWWVYNTLKEIKNSLYIIKDRRFEYLLSRIGDVSASIRATRDDVNSSVRMNSHEIKSHTSSEVSALRQMIIIQFNNQTKSLLDEVKRSRQQLNQYIDTSQILEKNLVQIIRENSGEIKSLNNSFADSLSTSSARMAALIKSTFLKISEEEEKRFKYSSAAIDALLKSIYDFNQTITLHLQILEESENKNSKHLDDTLVSLASSIKSHTEAITSNISHSISSQKELHNRTKSSFDSMNGNLRRYLDQLMQIDKLYNNLQMLYNKLLVEAERINQQETSLTSMVARHSQIFELTSDMNNTSKEILEFMKLYLVQSTLDNFKM